METAIGFPFFRVVMTVKESCCVDSKIYAEYWLSKHATSLSKLNNLCDFNELIGTHIIQIVLVGQILYNQINLKPILY